MSISLLETLKQNLTRQLDINIASARITQEFVEFVDDNVRKTRQVLATFQHQRKRRKSTRNTLHA